MPRLSRSHTRLALVGLVLVIVITAFVGGDWLHRRGTPGFAGERWSVGVDAGWVEILRAVMLVSAAVMLTVVWARSRRTAVLLAWAGTLVVLVADDLFTLHERAAGVLLERLGLTDRWGLRDQDLGELIAWAAMGAVLGLVLLATYLRSSPSGRLAARRVLVGVALIIAFAVGVDMVASAFHDVSILGYGLFLAEKWGETIGAGLVLLVALQLLLDGLPSAVAEPGRHGPLSPARLIGRVGPGV